jgi:hypothetical protein
MGRPRCGNASKIGSVTWTHSTSAPNPRQPSHQSPPRLMTNEFMRIKRSMEIVVPYPDPLIIPIEIKTSESSWGEMHKWKFA